MCLNENSSIARRCREKHIHNGVVTSKAFQLRQKTKEGKPEENLSVNWIEYFQASESEIISRIIKIWIQKKLEVKGAQLAKINVGKMIQHVKNETNGKFNLLVKKQNHKSSQIIDESHYGIIGFSVADNNIIPRLIRDIVDSYYPCE